MHEADALDRWALAGCAGMLPASSNSMGLGFFHRLEYLALDSYDSMLEPARVGLKTEPRDSYPSMYIGVEVPLIL